MKSFLLFALFACSLFFCSCSGCLVSIPDSEREFGVFLDGVTINDNIIDRLDRRGRDFRSYDFRCLIRAQPDEFEKHAQSIENVFYSPGGLRILSISNHQIFVWDSSSKELLRILSGHTNTITSLDFSPDSSFAVSSSKDNFIFIWHIPTGTLVKKILAHNDDVNDLSFSPNTRYFASASSDSTVRIWDSHTGVLIRKLTDSTKPIRAISYSPDGQFIWAYSEEGAIFIWDTVGYKVVKKEIIDDVRSMQFSPDGKSLSVLKESGVLEVYKVANFTRLFTLVLDGSKIFMDYSPDSKYIVTSSWSSELKFWDASNGARKGVFLDSPTFTIGVSFSKTGSGIVSSDGLRIYHWSCK
jgi:WD40 repeat protein